MIIGLESWTLARPELFLAAITGLLLVYGVVRGEMPIAVMVCGLWPAMGRC